MFQVNRYICVSKCSNSRSYNSNVVDAYVTSWLLCVSDSLWEDYRILGTSTANRSSSYVERKFRVKHTDHIAGRYKCSKCAKSYRWKHHLVEHVKASCGQKKAECCPYCSYKSNRKWNLKSHMKRIHASV